MTESKLLKYISNIDKMNDKINRLVNEKYSFYVLQESHNIMIMENSIENVSSTFFKMLNSIPDYSNRVQLIVKPEYKKIFKRYALEFPNSQYKFTFLNNLDETLKKKSNKLVIVDFDFIKETYTETELVSLFSFTKQEEYTFIFYTIERINLASFEKLLKQRFTIVHGISRVFDEKYENDLYKSIIVNCNEWTNEEYLKVLEYANYSHLIINDEKISKWDCQEQFQERASAAT